MTIVIAAWFWPLLATILAFGYRFYYHRGLIDNPDQKIFTFMAATIVSQFAWIIWLVLSRAG